MTYNEIKKDIPDFMWKYIDWNNKRDEDIHPELPETRAIQKKAREKIALLVEEGELTVDEGMKKLAELELPEYHA